MRSSLISAGNREKDSDLTRIGPVRKRIQRLHPSGTSQSDTSVAASRFRDVDARLLQVDDETGRSTRIHVLLECRAYRLRQTDAILRCSQQEISFEFRAQANRFDTRWT